MKILSTCRGRRHIVAIVRVQLVVVVVIVIVTHTHCSLVLCVHVPYSLNGIGQQVRSSSSGDVRTTWADCSAWLRSTAFSDHRQRWRCWTSDHLHDWVRLHATWKARLWEARCQVRTCLRQHMTPKLVLGSVDLNHHHRRHNHNHLFICS